MSEQNFAAWVEPIAARLEESRRDIEQAVQEVPETAWRKPSEYPGWSFKDHLSHLPHAHRGVQGVLQAVMERRDPDFSRFTRIDDLNEENRQAQRDTAVDDLLASFIRESEATQQTLAALSEEHAETKFGPMTISQALQGFAMHDEEHGKQIRKALQA